MRFSDRSRGRRRGIGLALGAASATVFFCSTVSAQSIDGFNTPFGTTTIGATAGYTTTGPDIFGSERDFFLENLSAPEPVTLSTVNFPSEFQHLQSATGLARTTLVWDGPDGNVTVLDPEGLGPADFTLQTKADAVVLEMTFLDRALDVPIRLHDSSGTEELVLGIPGPVATTTAWHIPFEDFGVISGSNLDYISIGAVEMVLDGSSEPGLHLRLSRIGVTPLVGSTKRDTLSLDLDQDGLADPGDRIQYTVVVTNPVDAYAATSFGVFFETNAPNLTTLLVGSVTTSRGTIVLGNQVDDTSVRVALGDMADGDTATIEFEVEVVDPIPAGATEITCQGLLSSSNLSDLPSDDPDVVGVADPTVTPLDGTPELTASLRAFLEVDVDVDLAVDPGDTLRYRLEVANVGDQGTTGVYASLPPPALGRLVPGSVTTSQGVVQSGNGTTDTVVELDIGTLVGRGGSAVIEYLVALAEPFPLGVDRVASQGSVGSDDLGEEATDDPDTAADLDPTVTLVETPELQLEKTVEEIPGSNATMPRFGYTLNLRNIGGATAFSVTVQDELEPNLALVPGTVTSVTGTVVEGNAVDDLEVIVAYATLASGAEDRVEFEAEVLGLVVGEDLTVRNQATGSGENAPEVLSDDPGIAGTEDPTEVVVRLQVVSVPTLAAWSRAGLGLLLALVAIGVLGRGGRSC